MLGMRRPTPVGVTKSYDAVPAMRNLPTERLAQPITWLTERSPRLAKALLWAPWAVAVVGLEALGRSAPADAVDGVGVALLLALTISGVSRHRERLLAIWRGERARRLRAPFHLRFGVDLRGTPALPHRLPTAWALLFGAVLLTASLLLWHAELFPTVAREQIRKVSGLVWLTLLGGLWSFLGGATLFAWALAHGFLESRLLSRGLLDSSTKRNLRYAIGGGLTLALLAAVFLPLAWALVPLLGAGLLHTALTLPAGYGLRLVWRRADGQGEATWGRLGVWNVGVVLGLLLLATIPILLAGGDRLGGSGATETAVTGLLGRGFAWSAAAVAPLLLAMETWSLLAGWLKDPARPARPTVHVEGRVEEATRKEIERVLGEAGMEVRFAQDQESQAKPAAPAARIVVEAQAPELDPMDELFGQAWPLRLTPERLADPGIQARLRRRAQTQSRRALLRGVERLWKIAAGREFKRGHGFWFAPHLWFVPGLTRDEDEGLAATIGPPYRIVFSHAARAHMRQVLDDLEVDLLYIEDGVGHRRLKRVLRALFEVHDLFGARPLEDERHFRGLTGVRVILHDLHLDSPLVESGYPEPDYEDLGRARVLHVFLDRGGDEEEAFVPSDSGSRPAPTEPVLV